MSPGAKMPAVSGAMQADPEPRLLKGIDFPATEESHGTQILKEGIRRRRARNEKAQGRHVEERPSGSGKKVTSRKQAIAIGLSEARAKGKKVPKKASKKRKTAKKASKKRKSKR